MSRDFLSLATEMSMLLPELAEQMAAEAARTGEAPETLIARRGLLSAVEMDIVQTLLRPTDVVPGYELLAALGHGGMGVVYRARQKTLDRIVAIKTILVSQMSDRSMSARFEQEARAVARLQHPNIIAAIDFGQHDGRLFFVMELVEGEDLEVLINRRERSGLSGSESESLAWGLARQAASGLSHAAAQGIVHRDIKPANLLLVAPLAGFPLPPGMPLVKIADFGLAFLATPEAEARTRLTMANTAVGSPHYIAPEQLGGELVDARADIYSLGATIFHLLAGRPPYTGLPLQQILTQKLTAEAPRLSSVRHDVSTQTDELVAAMMTRRPVDRIASYSELLDRIDGVCQHLNQTTMTELPSGGWLTPAAGGPICGSVATAPLSVSSESIQLAATANFPSHANAGVSLTATSSMDPTPKSIDVESSPSRLIRRRALITLAGAAVVGVTGWAILPGFFRRPSIPREQLKIGTWSEQLFDGQSLRNWQPRGGTWVRASEEEGGRVLSGKDGVIARRLVRSDVEPARPLQHFVVKVVARLRSASAVEVHFGLQRAVDNNGQRFAFRLDNGTACLVERTADRGESQPRSQPIALRDANPDQPRELQVRRDATHWFALVDEQLVGTLPLVGEEAPAEFRLLVEGGPAWFEEIVVYELTAP